MEHDRTTAEAPDPGASPGLDGLADALGEALLGDQYALVLSARRLADNIRTDRAAMESAVDELIAMITDEQSTPQELRVALTALGFADQIDSPEQTAKVLVAFAMLAERLAALPATTQAEARQRSLAQATPVGTRTLNGADRG